MPFTISHAVLAPPLTKLSGDRLPIAAIAIGCMTPDLYRLFTQASSNTTHYWTSLIHPDLWIGLSFCILWYVLLRPCFYRFLGIQHELRLSSMLRFFKFSVAVILAILLGTATHLLWDGLTHVDHRTLFGHEFLSQKIPLLGHYYPLHRILQIGTSALALPLLAWMGWRYYQTYQQHFPVSLKIKRFAIGLFILSLLGGLVSVWDYARYIPTQVWQSDLYYFTGRSINEFSQVALLILIFGCILFLILDRDYRLG